MTILALLQQLNQLAQQLNSTVTDLTAQLTPDSSSDNSPLQPAATTDSQPTLCIPEASLEPTAAYQILTCQLVNGVLTPVWASLANIEQAVKLTSLPDYRLAATLFNCIISPKGGMVNNSHNQPIEGTTVNGFVAQVANPSVSQPMVFFMPDTPPDIYVSQTADITQILAPMSGGVSRDPLLKLSFDRVAKTLIFAGQTYSFNANPQDRIEIRADNSTLTITNITTGDFFSTPISSYMDLTEQCIYTYYLADSNPAFIVNFCLAK